MPAALPLGKPFRAGKTRVFYKGSYDFEGLYQLVTNWIMGRHYRMQEKKYKDKVANVMGNEVEITLTGDLKETGYVKALINVDFHAWDYKEKEGFLHGEKKKYTDGRIIITIETSTILDWQKKFSGSKAKVLMGKLYNWLRYWEFMIVYVDKQEYEALKLEHEVKKFLKMETDTHAY